MKRLLPAFLLLAATLIAPSDRAFAFSLPPPPPPEPDWWDMDDDRDGYPNGYEIMDGTDPWRHEDYETPPQDNGQQREDGPGGFGDPSFEDPHGFVAGVGETPPADTEGERPLDVESPPGDEGVYAE